MSRGHYKALPGKGFCCTVCTREFSRSDHARGHVRNVHFKKKISLADCDPYVARPKEVSKEVCPKCGRLESVYRLKRNHFCLSLSASVECAPSELGFSDSHLEVGTLPA